MKCEKVLLGSMVITLLMTGSYNTAHAIDFIARAAIGNKSSELIIRDRSFTPDFITLDLSLTGTHGRYFLTLNNENSIKDAIETDPNGLIFFSRQDTNLTFGYSFDIAISFYIHSFKFVFSTQTYHAHGANINIIFTES